MSENSPHFLSERSPNFLSECSPIFLSNCSRYFLVGIFSILSVGEFISFVSGFQAHAHAQPDKINKREDRFIFYCLQIKNYFLCVWKHDR